MKEPADRQAFFYFQRAEQAGNFRGLAKFHELCAYFAHDLGN